MKLVNTATLLLKEFFDLDIPKYAILSHRWGKDEPTYKEYAKGRCVSSPGYTKVLAFSKLARERGHQYAWIDTICIDKRSSAELSEAINSMYKWYERSEECFAYLPDVHIAGAPWETWRKYDHRRKSFHLSVWWTRGWTLQELIAPRHVLFFTADWIFFGRKSDAILLPEISDITSIPAPLLRGERLLTDYNFAVRATWLSRRIGARVEDHAYCALGLFGINMPLLYGEGTQAWIRQQEEVIRVTDDDSIFSWTPPSGLEPRSLLAPSPKATWSSSFPMSNGYGRRPLYTVTNQGLRWDLRPGSAPITSFKIPGLIDSTERLEDDVTVLLLPLACLLDGDVTLQDHVLLIELACGHYTRLANNTTLNLPLQLMDFMLQRGATNAPFCLEEDLSIYVHMRPETTIGCKLARSRLSHYLGRALGHAVLNFNGALDTAANYLADGTT